MKNFYTLCILWALVTGTVMANEKPEGLSDEQWNKFIKHEAAWNKMLKDRFNNELRANPPEPPWIKYPNRHPSEIFWRMGNGEDYLVDYFGLYFKYASKSETKAYIAKYPEHKDWLGTYKNFEN